MRRAIALAALGVALAFPVGPARGFGAVGVTGGTLEGAARWDAAPRVLYGQERSLAGGLRYSIQGGSYEAFRDRFDWGNHLPTVAQFQDAVEGAFAQWTVTDPATGLGTNLAFVPDFATAPEMSPFTGAQIDLFGEIDGPAWDPNDEGILAATDWFAEYTNHGITLTSGTTGYAGSAMGGADIVLNANVVWSLYVFETVLAHELGHALGLSDIDLDAAPYGRFIDDNYDGTSADTARATLNNSFAALIDPYDPAASPLQLYYVPPGDKGVDAGVMLMRSPAPFLVYISEQKLRNDDFAGRQFLYPFVLPEPGALPSLALGAAALALLRRRR
ncbi:MAG: PEP-CTERM sorting domain-containing protein [Deltaproteobacteria bacterium]|nr:MAG: PEP-CTERM sorting domain-containing protein [Deltaproteobacteria bacterium]